MLTMKQIKNLCVGDCVFTYDNDINKKPITLYYENHANIPGILPTYEIYLIFRDWNGKLYTFFSNNVHLYSTKKELESYLGKDKLINHLLSLKKMECCYQMPNGYKVYFSYLFNGQGVRCGISNNIETARQLLNNSKINKWEYIDIAKLNWFIKQEENKFFIQ